MLVSTASPFKFPEDVLRAILGQQDIKDQDEFQVLETLASLSKWRFP